MLVYSIYWVDLKFRLLPFHEQTSPCIFFCFLQGYMYLQIVALFCPSLTKAMFVENLAIFCLADRFSHLSCGALQLLQIYHGHLCCFSKKKYHCCVFKLIVTKIPFSRFHLYGRKTKRKRNWLRSCPLSQKKSHDWHQIFRYNHNSLFVRLPVKMMVNKIHIVQQCSEDFLSDFSLFYRFHR